MKADDVKRLKELELENARLKRIVAEQTFEVQALKEIAKGRMTIKLWAQFFLLGACCCRCQSARGRS